MDNELDLENEIEVDTDSETEPEIEEEEVDTKKLDRMKLILRLQGADLLPSDDDLISYIDMTIDILKIRTGRLELPEMMDVLIIMYALGLLIAHMGEAAVITQGSGEIKAVVESGTRIEYDVGTKVNKIATQYFGFPADFNFDDALARFTLPYQEFD